MSKCIFVTGTGTDVGKTYVTGLMVKKLKESGVSCGYYKAAMSGNDRGADGSLIPGDAAFVKDISGIRQDTESMCPYVYENAVSPHLASRIEGNPVRMEVVKEGFMQVCREYEYVTMEGSGGILCPICYDQAKIQLEDIIHELGLASVIVADAGLGTINAVVLTVEYMKARQLPVNGIIYNHYHPGNVMEDDNIKMCEEMTGIPTLAKVQDGDKEIRIDIEVLLKIYQ